MKEVWKNGRTTTCTLNGVTGSIIELGNGSVTPFFWEVEVFKDFGQSVSLDEAKKELLEQLQKINA
jgi:hypothetical protein